MTDTDFIGMSFGKWIVIKHKSNTVFICKCECGSESSVRRDNLISGKSTKCKFCRNKKHGNSTGNGTKSGRTRTYNIWLGMNARCNNLNMTGYHNYGGRGISVCKDWVDFNNFHVDMGDVPSSMTLDRINVNGNYEKSNCRWVTHKEQCRNTRRSSLHTVNGKTATIAEWAEIKGMPARQLRLRMVTKNLTMQQCLELPYNPRR